MIRQNNTIMVFNFANAKGKGKELSKTKNGAINMMRKFQKDGNSHGQCCSLMQRRYGIVVTTKLKDEIQYVYRVFTLNGTDLGFTYASEEDAQAKCELLFNRQPSGNFTYYKEKLL